MRHTFSPNAVLDFLRQRRKPMERFYHLEMRCSSKVRHPPQQYVVFKDVLVLVSVDSGLCLEKQAEGLQNCESKDTANV